MLSEEIRRLYQHFRLRNYRALFGRIREKDGSLSATEAFAADVIFLLGSPTITQLAETLGISQPNATYKLNQLIQKGYVEKVPSTADRRELHLHVTDKYMRYWNESSSTMHRALDLLQQRFSDGELAVFSRMLQVLADTLSASGTDL